MPLRAEFQSEPSDSRELFGRGKGAEEEAAAMTRFRSTSLTLILLRLERFGTLPCAESWVTVPVGEGVRAR